MQQFVHNNEMRANNTSHTHTILIIHKLSQYRK